MHSDHNLNIKANNLNTKTLALNTFLVFKNLNCICGINKNGLIKFSDSSTPQQFFCIVLNLLKAPCDSVASWRKMETDKVFIVVDVHD